MTASIKIRFFALTVLIVLFAIEVLYFLHSKSKLQTFIETPLPSSYQEHVIPAFQKPDLSDSSYLLNPIFNSSRKPIALSQITELTNPVSTNIDKWTLVGIVTGLTINKAILYNQETRKHKVVMVDDTIDGWVVANISPTHLILQADGLSKTLSLDLSKKTSIKHDIFNTPNLIRADE